MESKKRKKIREDSDSESESNDESEIGTEELEEILRESRKKKNNEKSAVQGLSLVEESGNKPIEENMMIVWVETQSQTEALSITPEPPPKTKQSTPTLSPAPSKVNPDLEDAAALMMMAQTASYIPKQGSGVKLEGKTPPLHKQCGEQSFEKFETPTTTNEISAEMKEKCYIWATRVKTYADGNTNEYDAVCTLIAQDKYILSKLHFACLQADTHIEAEKDDHKIHTPYINISSQKTTYDCAIYVMKWLEIIQPRNVKKGKYEWDNWNPDEMDHYRVEYAS
ncbi:hypothetical protein AHAS_AhasUnG0045000 [Arachis hypogaea]